MALPINIEQLQSFLGFYNYYNRFIKKYSWIFALFKNILQKDTARAQGDQPQASFEELVHTLISALVLQMLQCDKLFTVHVDASNVAIGAVLIQKVDDMDIPYCYYSKRLKETEAHWSIYECELYAIPQALGKQWCYLVNRYMVVYSDHQCED